MPKILAGNTAKLAEVKSDIEKFKTRTGIDPRSFDQVAFGMHYTYPAEGVTKIDTVAIARGTFKTDAFVAAGRSGGEGKNSGEKDQGHTIHIFTLRQKLKQDRLVCMAEILMARSSLCSRAQSEPRSHEPESVRGFGCKPHACAER